MVGCWEEWIVCFVVVVVGVRLMLGCGVVVGRFVVECWYGKVGDCWGDVW